jgi:2,4-dienoyl-CoA reductase-like NADH-dependent reductase (Old Yellow Enzyme family)/thioredoxin reductase
MTRDRESTHEGDLSRLWEPVQVGPVTIGNRIFVSAHETLHGDNRLMSERYIEYVAARARGGAGLVMPGGASVHPNGEHQGHLPIWWDECLPGYGKLADRVHEEGAKVFVQLFHRGHQDSGTDLLENWHAVPSASAIASPVFRKVAKPLEQEEIADIVAHYGRSAANMKQAGIDGVEISAGHGYLICQFLSPWTNRREDRYGGSEENRSRLLREVLEEVRRNVGTDFPIGIRVSFNEFIGDAGLTPELSERLLREVRGWGLIDYISISGANYHSLHYLIATMSAERGAHFAADAGRARRAIEGALPIFVASGVRTLSQAAEIVSHGQADLIGMTRAHIADPAIVAKAKAGRFAAISRCVGANQGCVRRSGGLRAKVTCTVNPIAGREHIWTPEVLAERPPARRVVVVGGGPGGMKAAETAALRGHQVTLFERAPELGGQLRYAADLSGRGRWDNLVEDLESGVAEAGVDVRLDTEADLRTLASEAADDVILATGSRFDHSGFSMNAPFRDGIPGAEAEVTPVLDPIEALADRPRVGHRVVIVDDIGDTIAAALAITLAEAGHEVELVTAHLNVAAGSVLTVDLPWLMPRIVAGGVKVATQSVLGEIKSGEVTVDSIWGETTRTVAADTVVLCMLRESEADLFDAILADGGSARRVGDCLTPREVDEAVYEGMRAGLAIGVDAPTPAPAG